MQLQQRELLESAKSRVRLRRSQGHKGSACSALYRHLRKMESSSLFGDFVVLSTACRAFEAETGSKYPKSAIYAALKQSPELSELPLRDRKVLVENLVNVTHG